MLELAAQRGSVHCLEFLIKSGVSPLDHHDINERNLLHKLCILRGERQVEQNGVLETLLRLLPDLPKQTDFAGRRPLHYACEFGQAETARLLLKHAVDCGYYNAKGFADPAWQDREGHTPLFLAILHGNYQTLKVLIDVGKITDIDGVIAGASSVIQSEKRVVVTTFTQLASKQQSNGIGVVGENDTIPEFARLSHHPSAAAIACGQSNLELLNLIIDTGVQVDLADEDGETALHIAIRTHFADGVRALITRGHANVNLPEKVNAWTPLIVAG